MHRDDRKKVLKRLTSGGTVVVRNCAVLTGAFDEPGIELVIMACPTQSASLYLQMLGRGTRLSPDTDKTHLTVIDLADTTRHELLSAASCWVCPRSGRARARTSSRSPGPWRRWPRRPGPCSPRSGSRQG